MNETITNPKDILLPYQRAWVDDSARFKIGLMSRQVGKSFACAAEAVEDCLLHPATCWVVLSAGERQSIEFMEKAKQWAAAYKLAIEDYVEERDSAEALIKSAEIKWGNKSRMIALPANPATARGYSAHLILDEFGHHEKPDAIWRAIFPSISNPLKGQLKLRIVSTANGKANKFYDLWTKNANYSHHKVTIYDAVKQGLPVDIEELKSGLDDPEGWAQEYECEFIDDTSVLLPYDLIAACESGDALSATGGSASGGELGWHTENPLFTGVDIGRKHDLTVAWTLEKIGDVLWTREILIMEKTPFHVQLAALLPRARRSVRSAVDATGIGAMLAEELARALGEKIEQCVFTADFKNEIYTGLRRSFEDKLIRVPVSRAVREDLHGLQKVSTTSGAIRYVAPSNEDGHCDRATALALARRAAVNTNIPGNIIFFPNTRRARALAARRERVCVG
jgi:phage FluMu gp28-like protein